MVLPFIINFNFCGFFKRGIRPNQPSWAAKPITNEWGDWTWTFKTLGWLGTHVIKSNDGGETWGEPIPVNVRPLKHGGVRSGCWELPNGSILMGLYGRIRGYEEEGEGGSDEDDGEGEKVKKGGHHFSQAGLLRPLQVTFRLKSNRPLYGHVFHI